MFQDLQFEKKKSSNLSLLQQELKIQFFPNKKLPWSFRILMYSSSTKIPLPNLFRIPAIDITYVTIGNEANGDPQKADVLLSGVIG